MTRLLSGALFLAAAVLVLSPASKAPAANSPRDVQARARELVEQLGDDSFAQRQEASRQLRKLGLAARDVLMEGANNPDLEIQRRCRALLPAVLEADRQERLRAFIADKDGKQEHDLAGWKRFRQVAGSDAAARQLFIEMTQKDSGLLRLEGQDPHKVGEQCGSQCQLLYQRLFGPAGRQQPIAVPDLASLFLVAGGPRVEVPLQSRYMMFNLLHQPAARNALVGNSSVPFKKIVLGWMEQQLDDANSLQQVFYVLTNLEMKEGVDLALKVLHSKNPQAQSVAGALTLLGKLGGKEQAALLRSYLDDTTLIGNFGLARVRGTTQVRDVALAMLVHVTGQSHQEYGFPFSRSQPGLKFYASFLGFESDTQRTKAFARWREWSAKTDKETRRGGDKETKTAR